MEWLVRTHVLKPCILPNMSYKIAVWSAVVFGLVGGAFVFGVQVGNGDIPEMENIAGLINKEGDVLSAQVVAEPFDFGPYWRVWNILERKFIPFGTSTEVSVAVEDKVYRSIEGLVASYNDPYTVFMRPAVSENFKIATRGSLEGIGAVIGDRDGKLVVVAPLPNSPAEGVGLVSGDHIAAVDGKSTDGLSVEDAVDLIRGERGTEVLLAIHSEGVEPRDVPIVRGTIEIPSTAHAVVEREVPKLAVKPKDVPVDGGRSDTDSPEPADEGSADDEPVETEVQEFFLLQLFSFSQTSINAFERELKRFVEGGSDSLIIDLRGNPGGYLEAAVNIAGWFLPKGTVVVREYRGPEKKEILHTTKGRSLFKDGVPKIAILVNEGSASASEILAGALKEHTIATIVGTNTFGKGSVQELVNITDDLSLKVTVARWYTPNGVSISEGGLTPDVLVDVASSTVADPFVDAAIDVLTRQENSMGLDRE